MRPDSSRLGANVGFGYLGDDDDDDSAGGGGGDLFDALIPTWDATRNISESSTFTLAITANSAQTNGVVVVKVSDLTDNRGNTAITISTAALDGWSQTGWSRSGGYWTNTLTKASVASGTTAPSFTFTSSVAGTCTISTASSAPQTTEAVGGGQGRTTVFGAAAAFEAIGALVTGVLPGQWRVDITASGVTQTNGEVNLKVYAPTGTFTIATDSLDGWSESGWQLLGFGGPPNETTGTTWLNTLTRTNVAIGTTSPVFTISADASQSGANVSLYTYVLADLPHTDQVAEGDANAISTAFT